MNLDVVNWKVTVRRPILHLAAFRLRWFKVVTVVSFADLRFASGHGVVDLTLVLLDS